MRVLVEGSGGSGGWPEPGCRCASCRRQEADGKARNQSTIVIDGQVRLGAAGVRDAGGTWGAGERGGVRDAEGYLVRPVGNTPGGESGGWEVTTPGGESGGWEVTTPGGERLLYAWAAPDITGEPYDVAFLDLLGDPFQLGRLRAGGVITPDTVTVVACADHRVPSERELERRCGFWGVRLAGDGDEVNLDRSGLKGFSTRGGRVLVLGGARSGKSERAELRLAGEPDVTYVATGPSGGDREWEARVAAHRVRRPAWWRTAETTDLAGVLAGARGALLIDGIGTWLAAVLDECGWDPLARDALERRTRELAGAWRQTRAHVVAVSDETGLGVVPATAAGRLFRDELGRLNQVLAAESEEAELVVAGRVLAL